MASLPNSDGQRQQQRQQQAMAQDDAFIPREAVVRLFESIQESNQDIVIHTNTGTFTAEAREPDRKRRMFLQLQHARRLCNTFERAAESSNDAHSLLEDHKADLCELTCLTEAFFQRHSLDSYHYYTHQMEDRQHKQQRRLESAKELLCGTLKNWAKELKGDSSQNLQPESQPREQINEVSSVSIAATKRRRRGKAVSIAARRRTRNEVDRKTKTTPDSIHEIGEISEHSKEGVPNVPLDAEDTKVKVAATAILSSPALSSSNNTHTSHSQSPEPCNVDTLSSTLEHMAAATFEKVPQTSSGGAIQPSRRCHHCKNSDRTYLRCNFFNTTGFKCLKPYCKSCLTSFYELQDFDSAKKNERDWFCPSCLGYCLCLSCLKARERLGRRSQNTRLRKAS